LSFAHVKKGRAHFHIADCRGRSDIAGVLELPRKRLSRQMGTSLAVMKTEKSPTDSRFSQPEPRRPPVSAGVEGVRIVARKTSRADHRLRFGTAPCLKTGNPPTGGIAFAESLPNKAFRIAAWDDKGMILVNAFGGYSSSLQANVARWNAAETTFQTIYGGTTLMTELISASICEPLDFSSGAEHRDAFLSAPPGASWQSRQRVRIASRKLPTFWGAHPRRTETSECPGGLKVPFVGQIDRIFPTLTFSSERQ